MEAWLALRGLGTLDLRLARQAENAAALVEVLLGHPAVTDVRWPGHPGDPAHELAARQMRRWNGVLRFTLPSERAVGQFLAASRLVGVGDQLRRVAQHRRPPGALGRRRRARPGPVLRRAARTPATWSRTCVAALDAAG